MRLWEKFKSGFTGDSSAIENLYEPASAYKQAEPQVQTQPIQPAQTAAELTNKTPACNDNINPIEIYEMAINYYSVSSGKYKQDLTRALNLFTQAAELNHPYSNMYLGLMYLYGMGCSKNNSSAIKYLIKASELGIGEAHRYLADIYSSDKYNRRSFDYAKKHFIKYFNSDVFHNNGSSSRLTNQYNFLFQNESLKEYFEFLLNSKVPLTCDYINKYKDDIINCYVGWIDTYNEMAIESDTDEYLEDIEKCKKMIGILKPDYYFAPYSKRDLASQNNDSDFLDTLSLTKGNNNWDEYFNAAEAFYYGLDDEIQDYKEALKYYKKAAEMGSDEAMRMLGVMYKGAEGCKQNHEKALDYFKEGVSLGNINCYAEMAELFADCGHFENASKCWDKFFNSDDPSNKRSILTYAFFYLLSVRYYGIKYKYKHELLPYKSEIVTHLEKIKTLDTMRGDHDGASDMNAYFDYLR